LSFTINVKENVFSERELKKALRDTVTRIVVWTPIDNGKHANQMGRLVAVVVKIIIVIIIDVVNIGNDVLPSFATSNTTAKMFPQRKDSLLNVASLYSC